jgi:hypothetical protein
LPCFAKRLLKDDIAAATKQAEQTGVAWAIGVIDELHLQVGDWQTDPTYKGIKNTIRDTYKAVTGD